MNAMARSLQLDAELIAKPNAFLNIGIKRNSTSNFLRQVTHFSLSVEHLPTAGFVTKAYDQGSRKSGP